jgi:murein lipoprotein
MRNTLIPIFTFGFLLLGGCQSSGTAKPDVTAPAAAPAAATEAAKPALSEEARQALAKAEADVKEAKSQKSLWTTAEDALKKAQEAAAKNDSAATLKYSKVASEQAGLGLAQKGYPSTK